MLDTILGANNKAWKHADKSPCPPRAFLLVGKTSKKQIDKLKWKEVLRREIRQEWNTELCRKALTLGGKKSLSEEMTLEQRPE